ncbi:ion channel [Streptomyces sp. NPDC020858]|uniref:ion channel n=1 Tax=Streptomyces sp. NPDC020858 TaxID=3365097 RepID=UPI0037B231E2
MEHSAPGSFSEPLSRTDGLHFEMTVFSTVGFGDVTMRSESAGLLTTGQVTLHQRRMPPPCRTAPQGAFGGPAAPPRMDDAMAASGSSGGPWNRGEL